MERQNSFAEYPDSDQSISEEEQCVSLREVVVQKLEDNDPPGCGDKRQDGSPTWCTMNQEAEALIHENKVLSSSSSHSTFSKLDRPCKGIRRKTKPKFSFHFQSKKRELSRSGTTKDEHLALYNLHKQPETEWETGLHFPMECLEDIEEDNIEMLDITPVEVKDSRREHREMSIAELLDGIQDNTSLQTDGVVSRKKRQIATQMDVLLSCDRQDDNEDLTKSMNSDSPSDSEDGDQTSKLFIPKTSRKTITDKFEEFLGATLFDTENAFVTPPEPSRIGLFGKLQQVMQTEKLRDVEFLDKLHSETSANDATTEYLDVKIMDKDFEAKLMVCGCFFYENSENSLPPPYTPNMENGMKKKMVIFNPRVCNSIDLGVGMFIRIHAPWIRRLLGGQKGKCSLVHLLRLSSWESVLFTSDRLSCSPSLMATVSAVSSAPSWPNNSASEPPASSFLPHADQSERRNFDSDSSMPQNHQSDSPISDLHVPRSVSPESPVVSLSVLHLSFNQDRGCFAVGTDHGFRIYNCDPFRELFRRDFDRGAGVGIVEMLFRCNILAIVGGGVEPQYPPNKVMIWDDHQSRCIGELSFRSVVRGVRLRRDRIFVVLEQKVFVYNFADLKLLHQIETIANPKGLCEVSQLGGSLVLVCPGLQKGQIRVEHYSSKRTKFILAHDSRIACFALSQDGQLLATASTKGTLIRVFNTVDGTLLQEVRRGADRAEIYSLAFSASAQWLAVSSDKGTVHVFSLKVNSGSLVNDKPQIVSDSTVAVATPSSLVSFIRGVLPKYFSSEWSVSQFRLVEGSQYVVAFGHQKNTLVILGMDGSFYRCQFDPTIEGEMTQIEYRNFLKPEEGL